MLDSPLIKYVTKQVFFSKHILKTNINHISFMCLNFENEINFFKHLKRIVFFPFQSFELCVS